MAVSPVLLFDGDCCECGIERGTGEWKRVIVPANMYYIQTRERLRHYGTIDMMTSAMLSR